MFDQLKPSGRAPKDDYAALEAQGVVPRSGRGQPLLWLPDGSKRAAYGRPSSLGSQLDDKENLFPWHRAKTAIGAYRFPDVLALMDQQYFGDWDSVEGKALAKEIGTRLFKLGGGESKATAGTALHEITEQIDNGIDPGFVPDEIAPLVDAYRALMAQAAVEHDLQVLDTEVFVVNDQWKVAGTADKIMSVHLPEWDEPRVVIGDSKTSQTLTYSMGKFCLQLRAYAGSVRYDPQQAFEGRDLYGLGVGRSPIATLGDTRWDRCDREVGFIIHFPSGSSEAHLVQVDLTPAVGGYKLAQEIKEWRNFWNRKAQRPSPLLSVHN